MADDGDYLVFESLQYPKRATLIIVFLCLSLSFLLYQRTHKLSVIVLQSYNQSMPWVQGLERGVESVFKSKRYVDVRTFYMNTKRMTSKSYLKRVGSEAIELIQHYNPDVVIIFDIDAQKLVVEKLMGKFNNPIVLAGVTDAKDLSKYQQAVNITGIVEKIPVKVVQEILSLMLAKKARVSYLSDNSASAIQLDKDISNENWGDLDFVSHNRVESLADWKKAILKAQTDSDVILLSTYHMVFDNGKQVPTIKLIQWTVENSKIPVIGLYESFINDGGYLAIAVASVEQGYTAAKIAMFLLDKKISIENIPFSQSQTFQLLIRKRLVREHYPNITIPSILEAFSKTKWQLDDLPLKRTK